MLWHSSKIILRIPGSSGTYKRAIFQDVTETEKPHLFGTLFEVARVKNTSS